MHSTCTGKRLFDFQRSQEGLYFYKFNKKFKEETDKCNEGTMLVSTLQENYKGFSSKQVECAREARRVYHAVGTPGVENFKGMIKGNMIRNCPVTVADIEVAEK